MAYEPTEWQKDDEITSEKLNKIEQGVADYQQGPKGAKGDKGDTGAQGPAGKDAENQFTADQKEALLALIDVSGE